MECDVSLIFAACKHSEKVVSVLDLIKSVLQQKEVWAWETMESLVKMEYQGYNGR